MWLCSSYRRTSSSDQYWFELRGHPDMQIGEFEFRDIFMQKGDPHDVDTKKEIKDEDTLVFF